MRKSHKKKHKHKSHKHHKNHAEEPQPKIETATPIRDTSQPMLELRVPKLIVRKVVVQEGDGKTETMEVYSPDKSKKLCEYENSFIPKLTPEEKQRKRVKSRRSSRTSSAASHESLTHNKKRKKKTRLESSSSDENAEEKQGENYFFFEIEYFPVS